MKQRGATRFDVQGATSGARQSSERNHSFKWMFEGFRRTREIVLFRDPFRVSLLALREILRPFVYWYAFDIVENDLRLPSRLPYGQRRFKIRIRGAGHSAEATAAILVPMGELSSQAIELRCRRGDTVAIAYADDEPVGYSWMTFSSEFELVFGTKWIIRPDEAVFYGSWVLPQWRGKGVHSWLDLEMSNYARKRGIVRALGSISILNSPSLTLARKQAKPRLMTILLLRVRGIGWTYRRAVGAPLRSRFE